jgi:hypothetical protein
MLISLRPFGLHWVMSLALLACACGGDDDKKVEATDDGNEGGEPAVAPSYPPALGPEDCATTTSKLTLSQPEGAAVWGGLVVLEFEVEGAKVDSFDLQLFDPSLGIWTNYYVNTQAVGQRDDGSYFMAVSPYFSNANKDEELKIRVRPSQQGCPEADWTESSTFTASDPLVGTQWLVELSAGDFNADLTVQRTPLDVQMPASASPLHLEGATLELDFGKKGVFTEVATIPLSSKEGEPYDGCTLSLTFSGTYEVSVRQQYAGVRLSISERTLTSFEGTTCDFPATKELAISAEDFAMRLNAYTQQGISIDYVPTLFSVPGPPTWQNANLAQIFQQLPQFLGYEDALESGSVNGYVNVQDLVFERQ